MSRDSYRQGADDAQLRGKPIRRLYLIDPSYAEGFDSYMKEHPSCHKCGAEAQPDTNPPLCTDCMSQKSGGNDPETADEEMKALETRNLNKNEGDK